MPWTQKAKRNRYKIRKAHKRHARHADAHGTTTNPVLFETLEPRLLMNGSPVGAPPAVGTVLASDAHPGAVQGANSQLNVSITGNGHWQIIEGANGLQLTVSGTDQNSHVNLQTTGSHFQLTGIDLQGPLQSFSGAGVDLQGTFKAESSIGSIALGNVTGPSQLSLLGPLPTSSVTLGNVQDLSLNANAAIGTLNVGNWINAGHGPDQITGTSIQTLTSAGEFDASLNLSGAGITHSSTFNSTTGRQASIPAGSADTLGSAHINGVLGGGLWYIVGDTGQIFASSVAAGWDGDFTHSLALLSTAGNFAGQVATPALGTLSVGGSLAQAQLLIGADLGADGQLGGTGANADHFGSGSIGSIFVGGSATGSRIRVGIDPVDGVLDDGTNILLGGTASSIGTLQINGTLDNATTIVAGALPHLAVVGGKVINLLTDQHFSTTPINLTATPTLTAALKNDTGVSNTDRITNDDTIVGTVGAGSKQIGEGVASLKAGFDQALPANFFNLTSSLQAGGTFTLDPTLMTKIAGGILTDGQHTLHLVATDFSGHTKSFDVTFTLKTAAPSVPVFSLAPADATGASTAAQTNAGTVTLVGETNPNVAVTLSNGMTTISDNTGRFQFADVALAAGTNALTATAIDVAGNTRSFTLSLQRTAQPPSGTASPDAVIQWDQIALNMIVATASDTPMAARDLAIESLAVYDTVNAIDGAQAYLVHLGAPNDVNASLAIAAAAHEVLSQLFPQQQSTLDALFAQSLNAAGITGQAETDSVALGDQVADAILALHANDGSQVTVPDAGSSNPGQWSPTGPDFGLAIDPQFANVTPFAMASSSQFLSTISAPPALGSAAYVQAEQQVDALGSLNSTQRTADQTQIAQFWAGGLGSVTIAGQWNQIAAQVAQSKGESLADDARLFAELNVGEADAGIATWNAKYNFNLWSPVTALQQDGIDPNFTPLVTTPQAPEYVETQAAFSAAASDILGNFFGADKVSFTANSTAAGGGTRSYTSFSQAAAEAGMSGIYAGTDFSFSNIAGQQLGKEVGDLVIKSFSISNTTQPPKVVLDQGTSVVTNKDPVITGSALDNLSGVTSLMVQVDGGQLIDITSTVQNGRFSFTPSFALNGTADGAHTVTFFATDGAGNKSAPLTVNVALATKGPDVSSLIGANSLLPDGSPLQQGEGFLGNATPETGVNLAALSYQFDNGTIMPVSFDPATGAVNQAFNLSTLTLGNHTLTVRATDTAGNVTMETITVNMPQLVPLTITDVEPAANTGAVGVTFQPLVAFSRPVNVATLTSQDLFVTDTSGNKIAAKILPWADGMHAWIIPADENGWPGSSALTLNIVGQDILGLDGAPLDAAGTGDPTGSTLTQTFSTVSTTPVAGTSITGTIADPGPELTVGAQGNFTTNTQGQQVPKYPLAGVEVYVLGHEGEAGFSAVTDANGHFTLTNVPAGDVKLTIDGRTANTLGATGLEFPNLTVDLNVQAGQVNTIGGTNGAVASRVANASSGVLFLPRVVSSDFTTLNSNAPTVLKASTQSSPDNLTLAQEKEFSVTVQPNTIMDANGNPMPAGTQVGVSIIPKETIRNLLPPGLTQTSLVFTVQVQQDAFFTAPLSVTLPNTFNAPPGTKLNMLTFDYTTGLISIAATATVSADGKTVTTDPGQGISKSGWFTLAPEGSATGIPQAQLPNACQFLFSNMSTSAQFALLKDGASCASKLGAGVTLGAGSTATLGQYAGALKGLASLGQNSGTLGTNLGKLLPDFANMKELNAERNNALAALNNPDLTPVQIAGLQTQVQMFNAQIAAQDGTVTKDLQQIGLASGNISLASADILSAGKASKFSSVVASIECATSAVDGTNVLVQEGAADGCVNKNFAQNLNTANSLVGLVGKTAIFRDGVDSKILNPGSGQVTDYTDALKAAYSGLGYINALNSAPGGVSNVLQNAANGTLVPSAIDAANQAITGLGGGSSSTGGADATGPGALAATTQPGTTIGSVQTLDDAINAIMFAINTLSSNPAMIAALQNDATTLDNAQPVFAQVPSLLDQAYRTAVGDAPNSPYAFFLLNSGGQPTGQVIRGTTGADGSVQAFLPPNTNYQYGVLDTRFNRFAFVDGTTGPSGSPTILPTLTFQAFDGLKDTNGDGIPDIVKPILGLNAAGPADQIVAGMTDLAAVDAGLNAASNSISRTTGVVAGVALNGSAQAVTLSSNSTNSGQIAYVATGQGGGLAIVDVTNPISPVVQSQVALSGNAVDVAVDSNLQIAAVATGTGGLQLIDIENLSAPVIMKTINIDATAVKVVDGIAYANDGNKLDAIDLSTGELLQATQLAGTVTGVAVDGTQLYALDQEQTTNGEPCARLFTFDISSGKMAAEGSSQQILGDGIVAPGPRFIVSNGVAYIPDGTIVGQTSNGSVGNGYSTVDVSNPSSPFVVKDISTRNNDIPGTTIAVNGSGLGVSVGVNSKGAPTLMLLNTSDPTNTNNFITPFALPQAGLGVAIGEGVAYVADGNGGLQVVNYKPSAANANAPTLTITSAPKSVNPSAPGIELVEGQPVSFGVKVSSDPSAQVSNVELLLTSTNDDTGTNTVVLKNNVSAPFDLTALLPSIKALDGETNVTLAVRVIDTNGNSTTSTPMNITLVPDTTPPTIVSQTVSDGGVVGQSAQDISFTFSKPLDPLTISGSTFTLVGPNGVQIPISASVRSNDMVVDVAFNNAGNLPLGQYHLQIDAANVADVVGNPLGAAPLTTSFTVEQVSDTWIGPANGGNWSNAANWSTGVVPGANDTVAINLPVGASLTIDGAQSVASLIETGSGTLSFAPGASLTLAGVSSIEGTLDIGPGSFIANGHTTVGGLVMEGSTTSGVAITPSLLSGTGAVVVTGGANITNGLMTGIGTTIFQGQLTIANAGLGAPYALGLDGGRVLDNQGTANWAGGAIDLSPVDSGVGPGGTLINDTTGSLNVTFDGASVQSSGTLGQFNNLGSVVYSSGLDSINAVFNNSDSVEVDGGTLTLNGGGTESGSFTGTGTLALSASTTFTASSSITINGVGVGGTVTVAAGATYDVTTTSIGGPNGGTLHLDTNATLGTLSVGNGGILSGAGTATVTTETDLGTGVELLGSGTLVTQGVLNIEGNLVIGDGYTLENQGTANWTAGSIQLSASDTGVPVEGILRNDAGAVLNIATQAGSFNNGGGHGGDAKVKGFTALGSTAASTSIAPAAGTIFTLGNGTVALFDNEGTINQNGTNPTKVDVAFTNNGVLNVLAGTFAVNGGGSSTGTVAVAAGAMLQFDGANYAIANGVVNGAGEVEVTAGIVSVEPPAQYSVAGLTQIDGGTLQLDAAAALGSLKQTGGVLTGTGTVTVTGMTDLQNGEMTGTGTTIAQGGLTIESFGITIGGGRVLENKGVANWTGGAIEMSSSDTGTPVEGILRNDAGATFNITFSGIMGTVGTMGTGATALFDNRGTFHQTGTGTTQFAVAFNNSGTLQVDAGTVSLPATFTAMDTGTVTIATGASVLVGGQAFVPHAALAKPGFAAAAKSGIGLASVSKPTTTTAAATTGKGTTSVAGNAIFAGSLGLLPMPTAASSRKVA